MRRIRPSLAFISLTLAVAIPLQHAAAAFSDVPSSHPFAAWIQAMADAKIVLGNPDGTFNPNGKVNRAAFLVMLYRARGWTPSAPATQCKKDVVRGSWYEAVVCDALAKTFVTGYGDTFRPDQEISRVEALKMLHTVLSLKQTSGTAAELAAVTYTDVKASEWYMQYVLAGLKNGIIPLPGQSATTLGPNVSVLRGEAAAYIYAALHPRVASSSSSAVQASSGRRSADFSALDQPTSANMNFPFTHTGMFRKKAPALYRFSMSSSMVVEVRTTNTNTEGTITCRLYKLKNDGISEEYYLGYALDNTCTIRVSLGEGNYQLDVQSAQENSAYTVSVSPGSGDGNDGFSDADAIALGKSLDGIMEVGDLSDWYTYSVKGQTTLTVRLTNADRFDCLIYPLGDVDLYGFSGPVCNEAYLYPTGTYIVGVMRGDSKKQQEYAISVK